MLEKIKWPPAGKYVIAVSGGVDSVVLAQLLSKRGDLELVVGHFDHGWGPHSVDQEASAKRIATELGIQIVTGKNKSHNHSEAAARESRYSFLRQVMKGVKAGGIITGHHLDDFLETVVLNLRRGTGRRGLTPFMNQPDILRPLLKITKKEIVDYAKEHNLKWHEDPTNTDEIFPRNVIRKEITKYSEQLLPIVEEAEELNQSIDDELRTLISVKEGRASFPLKMAQELSLEVLSELIVMAINTARPGSDIHSRTVEEVAIQIKTGHFNKPRQLVKGLSLHLNGDTVMVVFMP